VIYRVERDEPGLFVGMQVDVFLDAGATRAVELGKSPARGRH